MSSVEARFEDASAFFSLFAASAWTSCHLRTDDLELFVSRRDDALNPMVGPVAAKPAEDVAHHLLRAPHLGTLVGLAEVGARLAAGQTYARLELLDEAIDLTATTGGRVVEHLQAVGALVEFDQPLVGLS